MRPKGESMKSIVCALLLVTTPVAANAAAPKAEESVTITKEEPFDPAQLLAAFDKLFPAQPDPAPARLALSRVTVQSLFPDGTYSRMMNGMMDNLVGRVLDLSEADFGTKPKDG